MCNKCSEILFGELFESGGERNIALKGSVRKLVGGPGK
jgi:hypothetical protein